MAEVLPRAVPTAQPQHSSHRAIQARPDRATSLKTPERGERHSNNPNLQQEMDLEH